MTEILGTVRIRLNFAGPDKRAYRKLAQRRRNVSVGIVWTLVALWIAGADSAAGGAFEEADAVGYRFRGGFRA